MVMAVAVFLLSASALAVERVVYVAAWRSPDRFRAWSRGLRSDGDPVRLLRDLFVGFKVLQAAVFVGWCLWWGDGALRFPASLGAREATALVLVLLGQVLNAAVFGRLGSTGVFYGVRFGRDVDWCTSFPFNVVRHPQYVGTVLTIWGFFLVARHPEPDWAVLPLLETAYYALGVCFERDEHAA